MLLTPFCLTLTCLQVVPDRSHFFRYASLSLSCRGPPGWRVKRATAGGGVRPCSSGWGSSSSASACTIRHAYPTDTGLYWCESPAGQRSNHVNITVTDRPLLLESPALPVGEGAPVTLRCRAQPNASLAGYRFQKDGVPVGGGGGGGELAIPSLSRSHQGLYSCSAPGGGQSLGSWLAVAAPAEAPESFSRLRLVCHLVVGVPYLLSTILLGLVCRDRMKAAQEVKGQRGGARVVMETVV
ncbi:low affinity immunoglobulin gamma Fc region receptor II-b-like isoform 4-T4 [Menidia menidia]